ncbi:MAG: cyclic lactone autoinducer peptide [Roseburia sp.]|nr:cyclic lactone autoinducer peptide [Roseburia sp.]
MKEKEMNGKPQVAGSFINLMNHCAHALMVSSANSTCYWVHHQPEVPEEVKKFRKF